MGGADDEAPPPAIESFRRRKSKVQKGEGLWLMSFSDMSLILMSFFVLQLSYSTPDKRKYDNLNTAMAAKPGAEPKDNLQTIAAKVTEVIKEKKLDKTVEARLDVDGLKIELKDAALFEVGSASLSEKNAPVVEQVMELIASAPGDYKLVIEGHTDDQPLGKSGLVRFKSNWDLSAARGISLLDSFKARGVAERRMTVAAYAHTRPKVSVKGLKDEALKKARAANRRVVIRIE